MVSTHAIRSRLGRHPALPALFIFVAGLLVYVPTLAPGLLWGGGDFALFQTRLYTLEGIFGGAFGHPLWVIVSHPFVWLPFGDVAYRANLAAAVWGAAALAFVFLSARLLTRSLGASLLATAALLVSHTFWTYCVMPKVYSLNTLLLAASVYLIMCWGNGRRGIHLYLFCVVYGLSLLNHLVMATACAGFGVYVAMVAWQHRGSPHLTRQVLIGAAVFSMSLVPYLLVSQLGASFVDNGSLSHTTELVATFQRGLLRVLTEPATILVTLGIGIVLLVYQFPVTSAVGIAGARSVWQEHRAEAVLLLLIALGDVAFLLSAADPRAGGEYIWNLHYYLQLYVVFAVWIAVGLAALWRRVWDTTAHRVATVLCTVALPVVVYALAPVIVRPFLSTMPAFRDYTERDNLTYVLSPWKHNETGPRRLVTSILQTLPPKSTLFVDYGIGAMLDYARTVEHARPDVVVIQLRGGDAQTQMGEILAYKDTSDLFLADVGRYYPVEALQAYYEIVPFGPVYRLVPR